MSITPTPFFCRRELLPFGVESLYQRTRIRVNLLLIAMLSALVTEPKDPLPETKEHQPVTRSVEALLH